MRTLIEMVIEDHALIEKAAETLLSNIDWTNEADLKAVHYGVKPYLDDEDELSWEMVGRYDPVVKEWALDHCAEVYRSLRRKIEGGKIKVWRVITAPSNWHPTSRPLGVYWSWEEDAAEAHWGTTGDKWLMHGWVAEGDVNWVETIAMNAHPSYNEEREIHVLGRRSVHLLWAKNLDGGKRQHHIDAPHPVSESAWSR